MVSLGTVTTVFDQSTADSSDDTYDCVACGDTEFADHDAHECLPSNNSCPVGSTPDDEMVRCLTAVGASLQWVPHSLCSDFAYLILTDGVSLSSCAAG